MKKQTKLLSLLISLALLLTILPSTVRAEGSQEEPEPVVGECEVFVTNHTVPEDDGYTEAELLEGYLYSISGLYDGTAAFHAPNKPLNDVTLPVYNALVEKIKGVAAGTIAKTVFDLGVLFTWTDEDLGTTGNFMSGSNFSEATTNAYKTKLKSIDIQALLNRLLSQAPFELYWFDKTYTNAFSLAYSITGSGYATSGSVSVSVTVKMIVSKDYAPSGAIGGYTIDSDKIGKINTAVANATKIVSDNAGKTDYEKLVAYRQKICKLVSYNDDATAVGYPYGDPWQLIYVFDGDESTNVVCEGYSKAFKYLCDLTWQDNSPAIECSLVTGTMAGGTGPGPHMWNVVAISGSNYLVDVTNCDEGTIGSPNQLFLCGVSGSVNGSYTATAGSSSIIYTYDESTKNNYTEGELKLSPTAYTPSGADIPKIRGKVISYNGNNAFTVTLYQAGTENQVQSIPVSGNKQSGQVTQDFTFKEVDTGTYDLVVTKACHLTYTIKNMVVGESPIDLTAMTGKAYSTITLLAGDVNGDGSINATDLNIVWNAANFNKAVADVSNQLTDVNGDGAVNATDLNNVWNAANFNKGTGDCTFNFK